MGIWVAINRLVALTSIWWRESEEKDRQRIRDYFSVHEAIRIAFPIPINSWEEAFQHSKAKVKSSTRKVGLYKQRGSGYTALSCWKCPFLYQTGINISTAWEQYRSVANPFENEAHGQSPASHWFLSCSVVLKASALYFYFPQQKLNWVPCKVQV